MVRKTILSTCLAISIAISLSANKVQLPDYEKWPVFKYGPDSRVYSLYNKDYLVTAYLSWEQYRSSNNNEFLDLIRNTKNDPWLIKYNKSSDGIYIFEKQKRFMLFGHKWKLIVSIDGNENPTPKLIAFQDKYKLDFLLF